MSKIPSTVTATFRQSLQGQLEWLRLAPSWAVPAVFAQRIMPLIVESRLDTPNLGKLLAELHVCGQHQAAEVIERWLAMYPE